MTAVLKWAGGKRSLIQAILSTFPPDYENRVFHEPFLGGGAVFFTVRPRRGTVNDVNPRLINFYRVVREEPGRLVEEASKYTYDRDTYYRLRDHFNEGSLSPVEDASLLLYLNKTGYNGLYRVNSRGLFNVPFGTYRNPTIVPIDDIYAASEALRRVEIRNEDFSYLLDATREGDLVYLDPPYEPVSRTSNFNTYNPTGFPWGEQERLSETIRELDARGALFVLSNSEPVGKLYKGFTIKTVHANRSINTKATARGPVREIIVTNIKHQNPRKKEE
jgi:DNA adenine methylase